MGATASSSLPSAPRPPLDYHEALRLATERRGVRVKVRAACASVGDGAFDPALRIEWIDVEMQQDASPQRVHRELREARALVAVWFALSCCPGFGEDENPVFWHDALFNNTVERWPDAVSSLRFTSTANCAERSFPRVRITPAIGYEEITMTTFLGHFQPDESLREAMATLRPFMCPIRWRAKWVDVAVCGVDAEKMLDVLVDVRSKRDPDEHESIFFRLSAVYLLDGDKERVDAVAGSVDAHVYVEQVLKRPRTHLFNNARRSSAMQSNQRLQLDYRVSALPHSRAITSLQLSSFCGLGTDDVEAAWLGYTIFHPEVEIHGTSFSHLKIILTAPLRESAVRMLRLMSVGNNLLYVMGKAASPSTGYHHVKLRSGVVIRSKHPLYSRDLDIILDHEMWVTSCESITDSSVIPALVSVVVPGIGIQQVERDDILDCITQNPSPPHVEDLQLTYRAVPSAGSLVEFLKVFHGNLTSLELKWPRGFTVSAVLDVLQACPQLKRLSISHDGSCWSNVDAIQDLPSLPRLETIELHVRSSLPQPLSAPHLGHLKVLRIHTEHLARFDRYRSAAEAMFATYPCLQAIECGSRLVKANNSSSDHSGMSMLSSRVCEVALRPLAVKSRVAFLSAIRHSSSSASSMCRLSRDEVALIFGFSSTDVPRRFVFQNF